MPLVRAIVRDAGADDYRFSSLVINIVTSDAFSKTQVPGEGPACRVPSQRRPQRFTEGASHVHHPQTPLPPHASSRAPAQPSRCRCSTR